MESLFSFFTMFAVATTSVVPTAADHNVSKVSIVKTTSTYHLSKK